MKLENSTSSLDTQMAKENAIKQIVTSGKESLNQLGSWISANAAKATLFSALTFTAPAAFSQTPDVVKNDQKKKIENTITPAKKDTNSVELKVIPEWRKEFDKAVLNTIDHINKNFDQYNKESSKMDQVQRDKFTSRFKYIAKYSKKIGVLSQILGERAFTSEEIEVVGNIQKRLTERSKEGLHPFLDKFAYLSFQEANALALGFKNTQIVKN